MGKLFVRLAGSITETTVNLENVSLELEAENITFANTVEIQKKLIKIEQQLNKITNSIQNSTFSELEKNKLQKSFIATTEKLDTIKNKLKKLQNAINSDIYSKEQDKLCKLLKKFNSHAETFSEYFKDANKKQELLVQLKLCKKHIKDKDSVVNNNIAVIEPEVHNNLNEILVSQTQNSQPKLSSL